MLRADSVAELLRYLYRNNGDKEMCLAVIGQNGEKTWRRENGTVVLNINNERFPIISEVCYEKIKNNLIMR